MTPTTIADLQTTFTTALAGADPLLRLRAAHTLETALAALRWPLVEVALDAGHTWAEIAAALDDTELGLILDHLHHQQATFGRSQR